MSINNIIKGVLLVALGATSYGMLATFVKLAYKEDFTTAEVTSSQFILGIIGAFIGVFLFISLATDFEFADGVIALKTQNSLGKLIALGAVINVILFFGLLKFNKELMARGVILAVIALAISTLVI